MTLSDIASCLLEIHNAAEDDTLIDLIEAALDRVTELAGGELPVD